MSQIALAIIGEGQAWYEGELLPSADALKRAGLEPVIVEIFLECIRPDSKLLDSCLENFDVVDPWINVRLLRLRPCLQSKQLFDARWDTQFQIREICFQCCNLSINLRLQLLNLPQRISKCRLGWWRTMWQNSKHLLAESVLQSDHAGVDEVESVQQRILDPQRDIRRQPNFNFETV